MKEFFKSVFEATTTKILISIAVSIVLFTKANFVTETYNDNSNEDDISNNSHKIKRQPASISSNKKKDSTPLSKVVPIVATKNLSNYNSTDNQSEYYALDKEEIPQTTSTPHPSIAQIFNNPINSSEDLEKKISNFTNPKRNENKYSSFLDSHIKTSQPETKEVKNTPTLKDDSNSNDVSPLPPSSSSSSTTPVPITCSTDILSGTFGNPLGVNITCNYLSSIKYCLAKDTCCDPANMGTNYTTTIAIGAENGNFCLSFYGESEVGGVSEIIQNKYVVDSTFPNITVGNPKTYFQTTELTGETFLTSNDFGKTNHFAGQINFKTNDPTTSGLDYSCQEIAENNHLSLIPQPSTTLALLDISSLIPTNEIKIPFREDKLDYGVNFLSSFIKNNSYIVPLYSCATTQITLEDFNYFESSVAQASTGDNNVREFEGQFMSFSSIDEETQIARGPASESTRQENETHLKTGLLNVFY